jgi:hypothetical protein
MSLAIDIDHVAEVLLDDGWHTVAAQSFTLDAYEYIADSELVHGEGEFGVCANGFSFTDGTEQRRILGPLTAILAVQLDRP